MKPVKLSELMDAVELDFDETVTMIDLQEGAVVGVDRAIIDAYENGEDVSPEAWPEWQRPELEIGRAIVEDTSHRFIEAPSKHEFHEYRHMERFIGTVANEDAAEQLWRAIKGKGAFRYFKDTAHRLGLIEQWYQYRDSAVKDYVIGWAEANEVQILDDVRKRTR